MTDFVSELRRLISDSGVSLRELARRSNYDNGHLSKIINGRKPVTTELALRLDDVLGAEGRLAALAPRDDQGPSKPALIPALPLPGIAPDPDLYERITKAVAAPARVDMPTVEWLEHTLAEHRRAEDTIGARPIFGLIRAQLAVVAAFTHSASLALGDRLTGLAAQYAQFLAWMSVDTGNHGPALAWYDRAHDWAIEAEDPNMAATTLSMKAHLAWSTGDPQRCIRMANAARWHKEPVTPGVLGMAAQMAARGHALAGDADRAHALLEQAQTLIERASNHPEDEPPWMYFYGENWFCLQRGMAELQLGNPHSAATLLSAGLAALPATYRRDRAWYGACFARAHAQAGDAEHAAAVALRFAADIAAINSYAHGELLQAAHRLTSWGAREGNAITDALRAHEQS
jgi:transcriptional regulator with XRE-family HTH domain